MANFCSSACQSAAWPTHKGVCGRLATTSPVPLGSSGAPPPVILIIGELKNNFYSRHQDLLYELHRRSVVVIARSVQVSMAGLDLRPQAVLLADEKIMQYGWHSVLMRVADLSRTQGCRLVIGADYAGQGTPSRVTHSASSNLR